MVSILKNGRHVPNSPITIMVVQSEIGDATRVRAHGDGLVQGTTFTDASFVVDTQDAGGSSRFAFIRTVSEPQRCPLVKPSLVCLGGLQVMGVWPWPSKVPVKWTSRPKTWRMGPAKSPTAQQNRGATSSPSASLRSTSQARAGFYFEITTI